MSLPSRTGIAEGERAEQRARFLSFRQQSLADHARSDEPILGGGFSQLRCESCGRVAGTLIAFMPGMAEDLTSVARLVRLTAGLDPMPSNVERSAGPSKCEGCGAVLEPGHVVHTLHAAWREDDRRDLLLELWWDETGEPRMAAELRSEDGSEVEPAASDDEVRALVTDPPTELSDWAQAQKHLDRGNEQFEAGELEHAEQHFRQALALRPRLRLGHFNLGVTLVRKGLLEDAQGCFRTATEINPWDTDSHLNLIHLYLQRDAWPGAEAAARRAIDSLPNDPRFHRVLGQTLGKLERYADAERALRAAVSLEPDEASGYFFLALAVEQQGRGQDALTIYQQCLSKNPERDAQRVVRRRIRALGGSTPGFFARLFGRD